MNITVTVSNCSNCPLFIYGTGGPGRDPDECGHPKFGVPHTGYTSIISREELNTIPKWCPLREEELVQTIQVKSKYTLTDGSTIHICKTCRMSPLCIVQTWPVLGGLQSVSHFQDGKPILMNDHDKEQFRQLMKEL